ncbi:MAG: hypothetical protein AB9844_01825 [Clostridiaceae bacterium]
MTVQELEQKIDFLSLLAEDFTLNDFGGSYSIDPCPVCGNFGHFFINPQTKSYASLDGCCKGGGVYQYLQEVKGMIEEEAYSKLQELAGVNIKSETWQRTLKVEIEPALLDAMQRYTAAKGIDEGKFIEDLLRGAIPYEYFKY